MTARRHYTIHTSTQTSFCNNISTAFCNHCKEFCILQQTNKPMVHQIIPRGDPLSCCTKLIMQPCMYVFSVSLLSRMM